MNNKNLIIIVLLLAVVSFLLGKTYAQKEGNNLKVKNNETAKTISPATVPPVVFTPKKNSKPEIKFFVMSFCPYGNQAEAGIEPVYQLLKDKVSWAPRYIMNDKKKSCEQSCPYQVFNETQCNQYITEKRIPDMDTCKKYFPYTSADECLKKSCATLKVGEYSSLHGDQELNQNIREICAYNMGNLDKWWSFVSKVNEKCTSTNVDTCWKEFAIAVGLDANKISTCEKNQKTSLILKEIADAEKYQATGSPTIYINETLYNGGRAPEDYKKAICSAFENPPSECNTVLGAETQPTTGGCAN